MADGVRTLAQATERFAEAEAAFKNVLALDPRAANAESGSPTPVFDVHLLGMGGEGHINSLFPHTPAVREQSRLVVGVTDSPKPPPRRASTGQDAARRPLFDGWWGQ